jgi:hypothetical protein
MDGARKPGVCQPYIFYDFPVILVPAMECAMDAVEWLTVVAVIVMMQ